MQFFLFILVFMMVQAVLFGVGTVAILGTELTEHADILMPIMIAVTTLLSIPASWWVALKMRLSNPRALHKWQRMPDHHP